MRCLSLAVFMIAASAAAQTHAPVPLTPDQKGFIVYHECMMYAAMRASHTDAKDDDIFGLAKAQCASTRIKVTADQQGNRDFLAALDAADAEKAAHFPSWIKGVRERRKARDGAAPVPSPQPSE